jgi:hypothetical protein
MQMVIGRNSAKIVLETRNATLQNGSSAMEMGNAFASRTTLKGKWNCTMIMLQSVVWGGVVQIALRNFILLMTKIFITLPFVEAQQTTGDMGMALCAVGLMHFVILME